MGKFGRDCFGEGGVIVMGPPESKWILGGREIDGRGGDGRALFGGQLARSETLSSGGECLGGYL
jgi:hypothetical protein